MIIVLKAVIRLADRYADAAESLAAKEKDPAAKERTGENSRGLSLGAGQPTQKLP